jgi:galactokinase
MSDPTRRKVGLGPEALTDGRHVEAFAPGRVNLIGEHTDYTGGLALPMAIHLGTTVTASIGGDALRLRSDALDGEVVVPSGVVTATTDAGEPVWGRHVVAVAAGVARHLAARTGPVGVPGLVGSIVSTLPVGGGLSSSASLEVALALAFGFVGETGELAALAQQAEQKATGVPCGLMDQLAVVCSVAGAALCIDFTNLTVEEVALPKDLEVVVVHSGQHRTLVGSAYADRRHDCEEAARLIGPLSDATAAVADGIADDRIRRRARHVVSENARVRAVVEALTTDDRRQAGHLLNESHRSLAEDFDVSTATLDQLVDHLRSLPGVHGARLTGAGFGGCVVALTDPGALPDGPRTWRVRPGPGAWVRLRHHEV